MTNLPDWQNKAFIVLATPKRPSNGYPFGLEMEADDGTRELHGPFFALNDAHAYRARLMEAYSSYSRGKIVKIETPTPPPLDVEPFPTSLITLERVAVDNNSGGNGAQEILVMALDYTGLPRAWAIGPISARRDVQARARRELQSYCEKQKGYGEIDLADYSKYTFKLNVIARCPYCENMRTLAGAGHINPTCGASECQEAAYRASGGKRHVGEQVELTRDCELGAKGERAHVTEIDGMCMTLDFFERGDFVDGREVANNTVKTGADYRFLRRVK